MGIRWGLRPSRWFLARAPQRAHELRVEIAWRALPDSDKLHGRRRSEPTQKRRFGFALAELIERAVYRHDIDARFTQKSEIRSLGILPHQFAYFVLAKGARF